MKQVRFAMLDQHQNIVGISPALAKSLGYRSGELINHNMLKMLPRALQAGCAEFLAEQIESRGVLLPILHRNGQRLQMRFSVSPMSQLQAEQPLLLVQISEVLERKLPQNVEKIRRRAS